MAHFRLWLSAPAIAFRYYLADYVFDAEITRTTRRSSLPSCLMRYWEGRAPPRPQWAKPIGAKRLLVVATLLGFASAKPARPSYLRRMKRLGCRFYGSTQVPLKTRNDRLSSCHFDMTPAAIQASAMLDRNQGEVVGLAFVARKTLHTVH